MNLEESNNSSTRIDGAQPNDILENIPVGILLFDKEGIVKRVNKSFDEFALINSPAAELIGSSVLDLKITDEFSGKDLYDEVLKNGIFERELSAVTTLSGNILSVIIKCVPILKEDEFDGALVLIEDLMIGIDTQKEKLFSSKYFKNIVNTFSDLYFISNNQNRIIASSAAPSLQHHRFVKPSEKNLLTAFSFENDQQFTDAIEQVRTQLKTMEIKLNTVEEGENRFYNCSIIPFVSTAKSVDFLMLAFKDITAETLNTNSLKSDVQEMRKYYNLFNEFGDAIINIDMDGKIIHWNDAATNVFGVEEAEVLNKFIGKVLPAIDDNYLGILKNELAENHTWQSELWSSESTKEAELLSVRMTLVENENCIVIICTNITERVNIEKQLRVSEERFRNIVTNTREYICSFQLDGKITYVNPFLIKEFGYTVDELLTMNLKDLFDPEQFDRNAPTIEKFYKEQFDSIEITLVKKDGSKIYVLANFTSARDLSGRISYYNAVFTDITEKKKAEKDLLMIRAVFEATQDGIAIQSNRNYILVNDSFANMFGYNSIEEVAGKDILDFVSDDDISLVTEYVAKYEQGEDVPERYVYKAKRSDGSIFNVEKSTSSYEAADGIFIVSTYRDITKEKQALDNLEVSEERYRSITENINDCVWSAERKRNKLEMVFYSEVIYKISGYTSEQFMNDSKLWLRIIHPNDASSFVAKLRNFYYDPVRDSMEIEYRIINNLGNVIWIKNKLNVLRDSDGVILKIFGLASDITLSKRAEEELKKSANELKVLNDTKDRFISIISHDLRTPFSSILGFTDMLLSDRNMSEEKQVQYINFIQESSRNMLSLVNSLLDWTRLQTGRIHFEPQRINAKYVVTKAIQMLSGAAIQKNINLVSDFVNDVYIHADENLLLQVFNNLISNAIKFTGRGGSITVSTSPLFKQRQVQFKVKDTGTGIKAEDIPKLFKIDTKYTTPGTAGERGSGLGLSLCYDIVKKHGGEIAVSSEYGHGTEMIFTIPVASTKILLVDDSRTDRILYTKILKNFISNYTVEEASNGKEAYEKIKSTYPALVITDHDMPVMSGYSLVQQLNLSDLKYKPPVIILSSDLNDSIIKEYRDMGIIYAFKKPVNLNALKIAVEKSLKSALSN